MSDTYTLINKEYEKYRNIGSKETGTGSSGEFVSRATEFSFKRATESWNSIFVENKFHNPNVDVISRYIKESAGDIRRSKELDSLISINKNTIESIMKDFRSNVNVSKRSILTIYNDTVELLHSPKMIAAFNYSFNEAKKNGTNKDSVNNIIMMCYTILVSFVYFTTITINNKIIMDYCQLKHNGNLDKFENVLESIQEVYLAFIREAGFTVIQIVSFFNSAKSPVNLIKEAIDAQKKYSNEIKSATESFGETKMFNLENEMSCKDIGFRKHSFGTEDILMVSLIVVGGLIALVALLGQIRKAIYFFGTFRTDLSKYIKDDVAYIMNNIETLEKRMDETDNASEKRHLKSVIEKQKQWVAKYQDIADAVIDESITNYDDTETEIESQDSEDKAVIESEGQSAGDTSNDDKNIDIIF